MSFLHLEKYNTYMGTGPGQGVNCQQGGAGRRAGVQKSSIFCTEMILRNSAF